MTSISPNAISDNAPGASSFSSCASPCASPFASFVQICAAQLAVSPSRTTGASAESTPENTSQVLITKIPNSPRSKDPKSTLAVLPNLDLSPLLPGGPPLANGQSTSSTEPVSENASLPAVDGLSVIDSGTSQLAIASPVSQTMPAQTILSGEPSPATAASPNASSFSPDKAGKSNQGPGTEIVSDLGPSKTATSTPAGTATQETSTLDPALPFSVASGSEALSTQPVSTSQPATLPQSQSPNGASHTTFPARVQVASPTSMAPPPPGSANPTVSTADAARGAIGATVQTTSATAVEQSSTTPSPSTSPLETALPLISAVISQAADRKQSEQQSSPSTPPAIKSKPVTLAAVVEPPARARTSASAGFPQELPQPLMPPADASAHPFPSVEAPAVNSSSVLPVAVIGPHSTKNAAATAEPPNNSVSSVSTSQADPNRSVQPGAGDNSSSDASQHRDAGASMTPLLAAVPTPTTSSAAAVIALSDPAAPPAGVSPSGPTTPRTNTNDPVGLPDAASSSSQATQPASASTGASPVQLVQMVTKAAQSEMRIGMNTTAFGSVEIRTTVHANDVGVLIGSERGDLRSLLANDLPVIANTLQQQNLRLMQVSFHQQGFAFSSDSSSGRNPDPRSFPTRTNPDSSLSSETSSTSSSGTTEPLNSECSSSGFSILA